MESRKLYRSRDNRMICGVCGGIGEYFNVDATLIRLVLGFLPTSWPPSSFPKLREDTKFQSYLYNPAYPCQY